MDGRANATSTMGDGRGGRYELLGRLAVGGMAELYLARAIDPARGRGPPVVVLKRILPHLAEDPDFVRMFHDEAHLAAKLEHPNIVRVRDIGRDGDTSFFTMEYVHGENLRTILKAAQQRREHIPLEHVLAIGLGVTAALHHAHEQVDDAGQPLRIVHRDVSPTNVLVGRDGSVKLVDFGIAKAAAATHITQAGMLKGKASYMSPEQCRADPVDRRSDVYSMGILLYELSTLTRLFRGDNELVILNQVLTGQIAPPSERREGYPAELERIVLRALAQRPEDRYATAQQMHEDLARFSASHRLAPSQPSLARWVHALLGPKPLPWNDGTPRHADASESGVGTRVDPLDDDQTEATRQRDHKTPRPRPPNPPPTGRAGPPRVARAPRPQSDRSPATPGRRSPWTGRRPNAGPTARPPGAPLPASGPTAGARLKPLEPAPPPRLAPNRVPTGSRLRVTPAPRPGSGKTPALPRRTDPSKPTSTSAPSRPRAAQPLERPSPPPAAASRSAPAPQPKPARVDRTQVAPSRPAVGTARSPTRSPFSPPFVSEVEPTPAIDRTQFAPTTPQPTVATTQPPTASASFPSTAGSHYGYGPSTSHSGFASSTGASGFDKVERTMVSSDEEIAALRSGSLPFASASGSTVPSPVTRYDLLDDELDRVPRSRLVYLLPLLALPILLASAAWFFWLRGSGNASAAADDESSPRASAASEAP